MMADSLQTALAGHFMAMARRIERACMNAVSAASRVRRLRVLMLSPVLAAGLVLSACTTLTTTAAVTAEADAGWALLPISNLSQNPQADLQARQLLETRLRARGVQRLESYVPMQNVSLRQLLNPDSQQQMALQWAREQGHDYAMTGTVNEWSYRTGADREPVVGLNLKLIDLASGTVLWQASAARTGWGFSNLPALADSLIAELLDSVRIAKSEH